MTSNEVLLIALGAIDKGILNRGFLNDNGFFEKSCNKLAQEAANEHGFLQYENNEFKIIFVLRETKQGQRSVFGWEYYSHSSK